MLRAVSYRCLVFVFSDESRVDLCVDAYAVRPETIPPTWQKFHQLPTLWAIFNARSLMKMGSDGVVGDTMTPLVTPKKDL